MTNLDQDSNVEKKSEIDKFLEEGLSPIKMLINRKYHCGIYKRKYGFGGKEIDNKDSYELIELKCFKRFCNKKFKDLETARTELLELKAFFGFYTDDLLGVDAERKKKDSEEFEILHVKNIPKIFKVEK